MNSLLRTALLSIVPISALFVLSAGCVASTDEGEFDQDVDEAETMHTGVMRSMPLQIASIQHDATAGSQSAGVSTLKYYGGPVLKNVNVIPIYWNASIADTDRTKYNNFYKDITNSAYMDWLSEYNTPAASSPGGVAQIIGRGTAQAGFVDNQAAGAISEAQIQARLNALFTAGSIPQPNANNYYAIHFPSMAAGSITASDGSKSCVQWCAFHSTYVRNGVNVYYGVMPDVGGPGCAGGCGANANAFNNNTSVASHELIETVTDGAVGLATVYGPPLGWYNSTKGEIGDICNAQQATVTANGKSYVVQKQYSNTKKACRAL